VEVMMKKALIMLSALGIATGGVVYAKEARPAPEVRPVGAPKSCVQISQIRSTNIIDSSTIDFKMAGGKTYRNALPHSCPGLRRQDAFSYRTSTSQLCNVDIIRPVENYAGSLHEGVGCGLGEFQQIERVTPAS
jgi:hypothetical protein